MENPEGEVHFTVLATINIQFHTTDPESSLMYEIVQHNEGDESDIQIIRYVNGDNPIEEENTSLKSYPNLNVAILDHVSLAAELLAFHFGPDSRESDQVDRVLCALDNHNNDEDRTAQQEYNDAIHDLAELEKAVADDEVPAHSAEQVTQQIHNLRMMIFARQHPDVAYNPYDDTGNLKGGYFV